MTKARLKKYRYYAKKCREYKDKIQAECVTICSRGSTEDFPFTMRVLKQYGLTSTGERLYVESQPYRTEKKALDNYIRSIDDLQIKEMFELVFIKGKTYRAAAFTLGGGMTEDCVRKRIDRYLEKY